MVHFELLFGRFFEVTGIPMSICNSKGEPLLLLPHFETPPLSNEYFNYCLMDFKLQKRDHKHPLILMFEPGLFLGVAQLDEDQFILFGPCGPFRPSREQLYDFCRYVIAPEHILSFSELLSHTPLVSLRKFSSALSLMIQLYKGADIPIDDILLTNNTIQQFTMEMDLDASLFVKRENQVAHSHPEFEQNLITAIENGDISMLKRRLLTPMQGESGKMSSDVLTQERYLFVTCAALWSRSAIRGGLPKETAYSLSDSYCQRMDRLVHITDIMTLTYNMALEFCRRVGETKIKGSYSVPIQKCRDYINEHLHEKISLADLSKATNLCTRTISMKFKQETGLSLSEYIHAEKMKEAKYLLKHTEHTLAKISFFLNYSSQSYFSQIFLRFTNQTPQQYRDS